MTSWVGPAVSDFGQACLAKLNGPGGAEAAIRAPLEALFSAAGAGIGAPVVPHDEVIDVERAIRADYSIEVSGVRVGCVEVKRPGGSIDPDSFSGHNLRQWQRLRDHPNLIYTNGTEWRLWRDGELVGEPVKLAGGQLSKAGKTLAAPAEFESLMIDFLGWTPLPITSVSALVRAVAPLTRLLRGAVLDQLNEETAAVAGGAKVADQPFTGLARDWRALLFPDASGAAFSDGYAQTVAFALLLARTEDIALTGSLHDIGQKLNAASHTLMGRALQLLTDNVATGFGSTLDPLVRTIGAVNWPKVRAGKRDAYLHLYEHFLEEYDPELRKRSGSYYTPRHVVEHMVRLTEEVLVTRLGKARGFGDSDVVTVDPAMGTGTYLHTIIERVADAVRISDGDGLVPATVTDLAKRLIGFEMQMGSYAVAELRTNDLLRDLNAQPPANGMRLFVTDTLDDPNAAITQLGSGMELIAQSRRKANEVKARFHVTVVIGNPPYAENAGGQGGWVEHGDPASGIPPLMNAFRVPGDGVYMQNLKNLYVYFWRWSTWKVWESTQGLPEADAGIVCFISTSGYMRGPGFRGMRRYLRSYASEGWLIDLTPEGLRPDVPTRIFPGVQQPLAIGLFVRTPDTDPNIPAALHYRVVEGRQAEKFAQLEQISLAGDGWRQVRTEWEAPLTPAPTTDWDRYPSLGDLFPWTAPGIAPNRTWVYAPSKEILATRWKSLTTEPDRERKTLMFKPTPSTGLDQAKVPLPGEDTIDSRRPFDRERGPMPSAVRVGYRFLDRQWLIPDARLMHRPRADLWAARIPGQVFTVEQHSKSIKSGPGVIFSALIPDMDAFKGSEGGRTLPLLNPGGRPNLPAGLTDALSTLVGGDLFGGSVNAHDVVAYVAAIVAHPAFTEQFADELTTPGIRVPVTGDPSLWAEAVALGQEIIWTHTYGAQFAADPARRAGDIRYPNTDSKRIMNTAAVVGMPTSLSYDPGTKTVSLGSGAWAPIEQRVFDYAVGGKNPIKSWFNYRQASPGGKKTSPLDYMHVDAWPAEWSSEFTDLLTVLTRLVAAEPLQADLLGRVLTGPILTTPTLTAHGVQWPVTARDRRPRNDPPTAETIEETGQLDFGV